GLLRTAALAWLLSTEFFGWVNQFSKNCAYSVTWLICRGVTGAALVRRLRRSASPLVSRAPPIVTANWHSSFNETWGGTQKVRGERGGPAPPPPHYLAYSCSY